MKNLKHTKDEWKLEYPIVGDFIIHADGLKIASVCLIDDKIEEQEANAKIMTSAPELLKLLTTMKAHHPYILEKFPQYIIDKYNEVIKKATK